MGLAVAPDEAEVRCGVAFLQFHGRGLLDELVEVIAQLFLVAGFAASFFALPFRAEPEAVVPPTGPSPPAQAPAATPSRRWGGVVFLGPIPIVFGSDARMTRTMLLLGIVLFLALLALTLIVVFLAI